MRLLSLSKLDFATLISICIVLASNSVNILDAQYGFFALFGWLLYASYRNSTCFIKVLKQPFFGYTILYCVVLLLTSIIGSDIVWGAKVSLSFILMLFPAIVYWYYLISEKEIKHVAIYITILIFAFSCYGSFWGYMNEDFGRNVTSGGYKGDEIAFAGVSVASGAAVFAIYLVSQIANKVLKPNILVLILLASQIALVITSGSTISTVCLLLFIAATIIPARYTTMFVVLLLTSILLLYVLHEQIGQMIIEVGNSFENRTTSERFVSLGAALAYGDRAADSAYFFDRVDRPLMSLTTFFNNPIFGVAYQYGNDWDKAYQAGVGCHGEWADALARFGLFAIIYFKIFSSLIVKQSRMLASKMCNNLWIVLGLMNPNVSLYSILILFFIVPSRLFCKE